MARISYWLNCLSRRPGNKRKRLQLDLKKAMKMTMIKNGKNYMPRDLAPFAISRLEELLETTKLCKTNGNFYWNFLFVLCLKTTLWGIINSYERKIDKLFKSIMRYIRFVSVCELNSKIHIEIRLNLFHEHYWLSNFFSVLNALYSID